MGDIQMNKEVNKLDDIETIDGNGQLYLALQDISMQNFIDELNKVTAPSGPLQSVVVSSNEVIVDNFKISGSRIIDSEKK